jgi:hypothetical protein
VDPEYAVGVVMIAVDQPVDFIMRDPCHGLRCLLDRSPGKRACGTARALPQPNACPMRQKSHFAGAINLVI